MSGEWPIDDVLESLRKAIGHECARRDYLISQLSEQLEAWVKIVPSGTDVKPALRLVNEAEELSGIQPKPRQKSP